MNCVICDREIEEDFLMSLLLMYQSKICSKCISKIIPIAKNAVCPQCNKAQKFNSICSDCISWNQKHLVLKNESIFKYNFEFSKFMHRFKYVGDYQLKNEFSKTARKKLNRMRNKFDLIIPIPLTKESEDKRLFNQVKAIFGNDLNEILKIHKSIQMSGLKHEERIKQEIGFEVISSVKDRKILLLDDVYTTGTTLHLAAVKLYKNGAQEISSLTLAR